MTYPGGKAGAGVYQRLINEIPPHSVYVAAFAGHDAIAQRKRPADRNILIDRDPAPLDWWAKYLKAPAAQSGGPAWELHHANGIDWMSHQFGLTCRHAIGHEDLAAESSGQRSQFSEWFVFLDPPYVMATRTGGKLYRYELTDDDHRRLIDVAKSIPCNVMLCGYWSNLYAELLRDWRFIEYTSVARSGAKRKEYAWCNYAPPAELHDSRFVGSDKREREKIRRRIRRLSSNLSQLPPQERQAVLDAVAGTGSR